MRPAHPSPPHYHDAVDNLLGTPETLLPSEPEVEAAIAAAAGDTDELRAAVAAHPASSLAWAILAGAVFDSAHPVESYAYARVGYHRGLDALRGAGWRGHGIIPWAHPGNRGVLRAIYALRRAAEAIGESAEVDRLTAFLQEADSSAISEIESTRTLQLPIVAEPAPPTESIVIRGED